VPRVTVSSGVELYYEALGEGTPIVFQAHDHAPWLFFQAPVFSQRYRVLTYDRRGTGRSSSPPGDWTAADLALDLAGFLARQPADGLAPEGPPTTDPAFAASPLGRMVAATGTGPGRTREDVARAIALLRDWDQRPRRADLEAIDVPTLVIVGEREPRSTIDGAREWASWIPGAEFVVLPGAHHAAPREAAPAWNAAVQGFLDRHIAR
jgi:pimeloyl-ACP methyl ester carboxylesterase